MAVHTVSCVYLCMSVREIYYVWLCICLKACVWAHSKKDFLPPPDTAVPNAEIEKEEDESSSQAQTPAEESSVTVPPVFNPPVQTVTPCWFPPLACISASLPPLPVTSCVQVPKRIEVHAIHTYVALYKFLPQEQNDLELQ